MTIINEEKKYGELKEGIRMMNSQRSDTEKINLIEKGKKMNLDVVIKHNEFTNKSLKFQIQNNVIILVKVQKKYKKYKSKSF